MGGFTSGCVGSFEMKKTTMDSAEIEEMNGYFVSLKSNHDAAKQLDLSLKRQD